MWAYNEQTGNYEAIKDGTKWYACKRNNGNFEYWFDDRKAVINRASSQIDEDVLDAIYRVMNTEIFDI